jgi:hypothetical protein
MFGDLFAADFHPSESVLSLFVLNTAQGSISAVRVAEILVCIPRLPLILSLFFCFDSCAGPCLFHLF